MEDALLMLLLSVVAIELLLLPPLFRSDATDDCMGRGGERAGEEAVFFNNRVSWICRIRDVCLLILIFPFFLEGTVHTHV